VILPQEPDLLIERDAHRVVRELRHLQTPAKGEPGQSARQAALVYLLEAGVNRGLLPLNERDWEHLRDTVDTDGPGRSAKSRFRWAAPRELKRNASVETSIVWCNQTAPLEGASGFVPDALGRSIRLVVHHRGDTPEITSARSTTIAHAELSIAPDAFKRTFVGLQATWADRIPAQSAAGYLAGPLGLSDTGQM
jgi:hypothetical protein